MKLKTLKLFTISTLLNLFAPLGLLVNLALFKNEIAAGLLVTTWLTGLAITLFVSMTLGELNFQKEEVLDEEIKKTNDRYNDNELFIKALKNVMFRKSISLDEVQTEHEKLKSKNQIK